MRLIFAFLCAITPLLSEVAYFLPPPGWQWAHPKNLSPHVQVGFVGNRAHRGFHPSISFATEEVDVSLKEYLKDVKEIHLSHPDTEWYDLGLFPMQGGVGRLTEIVCPSHWGKLKMLQAILIKENTAYILTASLLKEDFPQYQKEILQSLKSLTFAPCLLAPLEKEESQIRLKKLFASLQEKALSPEKALKELLSTLEQEGGHLGAHWQYLAFQEGVAQISKRSPQ